MSEPQPTAARLAVVAVALGLGFALMALRASQLALGPAPPSRAVAEAPPVAAPRADLSDRNGEILATTIETFALWVQAVGAPGETARQLSVALPDLDVEAAAAQLASGRRVALTRGLSPRQREAVQALGLPSLSLLAEPRRIYPRQTLAAHALGHLGADGKGAAGAERAFEDALARPHAPAVRLSLDLGAQHALDVELRSGLARHGARAAVGLVSDIATGEVLALVSLPDFDPNAPSAASEEARLNRAAGSVYELGSLLETAAYAMALDSQGASLVRVLATTKPFIVGGAEVADPAPVGRDMTLAEAFIRSSPRGAGLIALEAGAQRQLGYLRRLGLLSRAPWELAESAPPRLPLHWDDGARVAAASGQGLAVSPLAFLAAFGATANGGLYAPPSLRAGAAPAGEGSRILSAEASGGIVRLLRAVVVEGVGRRAEVPGYLVAGKPGAAQMSDGGWTASFAAVFPADAPRFAVLVLLEAPMEAAQTQGPALAGYTAAPVAAAVIARVGPLLGVPRRPEGPATLAPAALMRYEGRPP